MQLVSNEIALRPRFSLDLPFQKEMVLSAFEKRVQERFVVSRSDDHIFIRFKRNENSFWSPQLQLEVTGEEEAACKVYGLFGPNPTLWTFFMFLHFAMATLFAILGVWAYSSASLGRGYGLQLGAMATLLVLWFIFYALGRFGRKKGDLQMKELHAFFTNTLESTLFRTMLRTAEPSA